MKNVSISSNEIILSISIVVSVSFLISFAVQGDILIESFSYDGVPRAAILDQLYSEIPSEDFQKKAIEYLETAGYEVDVYTTENLTVDFYKELPKMNYQFIVFRTHAVGTDGPDYTDKDPVAIFTGEKYSDEKYIQEQLFGQLRKGAPYMSSEIEVSVDLSGLSSTSIGEENDIESSWSLVDTTNAYFMIGSKYVNDLMKGKFPNTIIVLGGCSTLSSSTLAESFIERGASSVVGWDRLVSSAKNDATMLSFLEKVLIEKMEVKDAVQSVVKEYGMDNNESRPQFTHYSKSI